jgi:succinate dehydrogenase/fumarate reductase flavoprotein subunit
VKEPKELSGGKQPDANPAAEIVRLQETMNRDVGPLRTQAGLKRALAHIESLAPLCDAPVGKKPGLDPAWLDWTDLRNMRLVASSVTQAALAREESRGAHQREDFPHASEAWTRRQRVVLRNGVVHLER